MKMTTDLVWFATFSWQYLYILLVPLVSGQQVQRLLSTAANSQLVGYQ